MVPWPMVPLREVAELIRRPVEVDIDGLYPELGIRSFGRGTFHKPPLTGADAGSKRLFRIETGDLVFNIVFAWEGAVAVAGPEDHGRFGSHRFLTFVPDPKRAEAGFIKAWFITPEGLEVLGRASPGGAGRNRTLGVEAARQMPVPLPPLNVQRRIVERLDAVEAKLRQIDRIREEARAEVQLLIARALAAIVGCHASRGTRPLGDLVDVVGGGTPTRNIPTFWGGEIPWVTPKDMKTLIISDAQQRITEEGLNASAAKLLPQNSILVVVRGMILARFVPIALLSVPATINQDMKALIPRPPLSADFLLAWLIANERTLFERVGKSTHDTRKLESEHLLSLSVPTLSPAEQDRFVGDFRGLSTRTSALEQGMAAVAGEAEQVLPALLAEAFGSG